MDPLPLRSAPYWVPLAANGLPDCVSSPMLVDILGSWLAANLLSDCVSSLKPQALCPTPSSWPLMCCLATLHS